jgi:hypothetical protein
MVSRFLTMIGDVAIGPYMIAEKEIEARGTSPILLGEDRAGEAVDGDGKRA